MSKENLKFGVITDLHHCMEEPFLDRYFRNTLSKINEVVEIFNSRDLDLVVNLGDTIDRGFENFDPIIDRLKLLNTSLINVPGNHDFDVMETQLNLVPEKLGLKTNYFEILKNNFQLLFLDGNEISTYANISKSKNHQDALAIIDKLNKNGALNGNDYNGGLGIQQLNWLGKKLEESKKSAQLSVIFCHFPIFPDDKHNLLNSKEVISIVARFNHVISWVCGHNHAGNYGKINKCHVINLKGLVETEFENAFSIFNIDKNEIRISGFGREVDLTLKT